MNANDITDLASRLWLLRETIDGLHNIVAKQTWSAFDRGACLAHLSTAYDSISAARSCAMESTVAPSDADIAKDPRA